MRVAIYQTTQKLSMERRKNKGCSPVDHRVVAEINFQINARIALANQSVQDVSTIFGGCPPQLLVMSKPAR